MKLSLVSKLAPLVLLPLRLLTDGTSITEMGVDVSLNKFYSGNRQEMRLAEKELYLSTSAEVVPKLASALSDGYHLADTGQRQRAFRLLVHHKAASYGEGRSLFLKTLHDPLLRQFVFTELRFAPEHSWGTVVDSLHYHLKNSFLDSTYARHGQNSILQVLPHFGDSALRVAPFLWQIASDSTSDWDLRFTACQTLWRMIGTFEFFDTFDTSSVLQVELALFSLPNIEYSMNTSLPIDTEFLKVIGRLLGRIQEIDNADLRESIVATVSGLLHKSPSMARSEYDGLRRQWNDELVRLRISDPSPRLRNRVEQFLKESQ